MVFLEGRRRQGVLSPTDDDRLEEYDVTKFLFLYMNSMMRGMSDEEKAGSILKVNVTLKSYEESVRRSGDYMEATRSVQWYLLYIAL